MSAEIQSAVASVHGLSVRRKLRVGIYSQAALRQFIVQQLTHRGGAATWPAVPGRCGRRAPTQDPTGRTGRNSPKP